MYYLLNLLKLFQPKEVRFTQKSRLEHVKSAVRRLRNALGLMVLAVLIGTFGYRVIEHVSLFDAYYMSLVTLSTLFTVEKSKFKHAITPQLPS